MRNAGTIEGCLSGGHLLRCPLVSQRNTTREGKTMVDLNGNTWPQQWADAYNNMTRLIESTYGVELREEYLNQRHRFYMLCVAILAEG